ncbi:MAG TPA: 50S ribosomal protein L24e [Nitrososphaerales archaeon]|nr:50S ribosomal protein L24e [Nitrososphaerales archaeon]
MSYTPKKCSFCGRPVLLGQGVMYVRNDAVTFWYCSTKCRKNAMILKRDPRKLKWARGRPVSITQKAKPSRA